MENGITDVHPLIGGMDAWQQAGYPMEPKENAYRLHG
jgi:rhodanese-related sulfurtransferase